MNNLSRDFTSINELTYCNILTFSINREKTIHNNNINYILNYIVRHRRNFSNSEQIFFENNIGKTFSQIENDNLVNSCQQYYFNRHNNKIYYRTYNLTRCLSVIKIFAQEKNLLIMLELERYDNDTGNILENIRLNNINDLY